MRPFAFHMTPFSSTFSLTLSDLLNSLFKHILCWLLITLTFLIASANAILRIFCSFYFYTGLLLFLCLCCDVTFTVLESSSPSLALSHRFVPLPCPCWSPAYLLDFLYIIISLTYESLKLRSHLGLQRAVICQQMILSLCISFCFQPYEVLQSYDYSLSISQPILLHQFLAYVYSLPFCLFVSGNSYDLK